MSGTIVGASTLSATTGTFSGILKTDDATDATSTTDGSLQTDGGLSVAKDTIIGNDLKLLSDSAVLVFGAGSDATLTHTNDVGLTLNSTNKLMFNDASQFIQGASATVLDIAATDEIELTATLIEVVGNATVSGTLGVTGIATFTDDIIIGDGKTIGVASDADAITIASNGQLTLTQTLIGTALDISGDIDVDGTTNLDVVDIDGAVDMATTLQVDGAITSSAGATITVADNSAGLTIVSTDADGNSGPQMNFSRASASPADDDYIGRMNFIGRNDAGQDFAGVDILTRINDVSDGTEDASFFLTTMGNGSQVARMEMLPTETNFNQGGADLDFRVEASGQANALKVDGAAGSFSILGNSSATAFGFAVANNGSNECTLVMVNQRGDGGGETSVINRQSSDGILIQFRHANTTEGTISVGGSTVSYNAFSGSHWGRLTDNAKPNLLRGTVVENIDEMMDWYRVRFTQEGIGEVTDEIALPSGKSVGDTISYTFEGVTYDDAVIELCDDIKHTKVKVSDTADSKRVYGVFMAWDFSENDAVNDMYVNAVGTAVIRINKDVTVSAGDLLVSNGDGTAKVQDDDIIRSKTIGKVLTNIKQETYDDDSYTVPCALYCG